MLWQGEASIHRRGHCPALRANVYQHLEAVAWHLILGAVSSKWKQSWPLGKESTDMSRMVGNLSNKSIVSREEHGLRRKKIMSWEQEENSQPHFLWTVVNGEHLLVGHLRATRGRPPWLLLTGAVWKNTYDHHMALFQQTTWDSSQIVSWSKYSQIISSEVNEMEKGAKNE